MLKQTFSSKTITKCANCDRYVAEHQLWMHGKGYCSKKLTTFELKVIAAEEKLSMLRRGLPVN